MGPRRRLGGEPDGDERTEITELLEGDAGMPHYGAGGNAIVFAARAGQARDIYLWRRESGKIVNLTQHPARENFPALSADGTKLAFVSDREGWRDEETGERSFDVYVADFVDSRLENLRRITSGGTQNGHVRFSPDGEWIVYTSGKHGVLDEPALVQAAAFAPQLYGEIYLYRLSTGESVRLTHNKSEDGGPYWTQPVR